MNPPSSQVIHQSRIMNQIQLSQDLNHPVMTMNHQQHVMNMAQSQSQAMLNNQPLSSLNPNLINPNNYGQNWKGKKMDPIWIMHNSGIPMGPGRNRMYNLHGSGSGSGGYNVLQSQNKKFRPKKKYSNRYVPYAPRNTSSFIIRAKKSGGIAELVSPCPVTPSVLPTPRFSPSREVLGDMAKEEWGVDGYGSMEGLIRVRSDGGNELELIAEDEEDEGGSCVSDVEVDRRLDHDLSRFEMIYANSGGGFECNNVLENRVDDQDSHIAQLEEDNLSMKERLFVMEREFGDFRRRLESLERRNMVVGEDGNGEVVENESGTDSETSCSDVNGETKENHLAKEDVVARDEAAEKLKSGRQER